MPTGLPGLDDFKRPPHTCARGSIWTELRRLFLVAGVSAATLAASPAASTSKVALDREHGVRFDLTGSVLTVRLVPQREMSPPDARKDVWGKRIDAICSPTFSARRSRRASVRAIRRWPTGQMELRYTFPRDISHRVKWCLLEDGGRDVASADFQVFIPVYGESRKDRKIGRDLRAYLWRDAGSERWLRRVGGILVDRGVISIATDLRRNRRGRRIARRLCSVIYGADVADFARRHSIVGEEDAVLRVCRQRE
jgi:hypothetical protein